MKKIFISFILLFCVFIGSAETGYDKIEWEKQRALINFGELADNWHVNNETEVVSFSTIILGQKAIECYIFQKGKFAGVCYSIPEKSVKELLSKFDKTKKILKTKTEIFSYDDLFDEFELYKKEGKLPSFYKEEIMIGIITRILIGQLKTFKIAKDIEKTGYKNIEKSKKSDKVGTLYIYDYNDDTRMYITSGNVYDLAFVAYVPHYKDY